MHQLRPRLALTLTIWLFIVATTPPAAAYSVLTHEQIVDLAWDQQLKPLLLEKYPNTTPDQLIEAHAYAYGGCVIQDMGYYPFGNKHFSDLVHYVRSGDFVVAMLKDAQDVNEYAFALGALAHYASDIVGHPYVNQAVSLDYPKLRARFGKKVTYEDNPTAHIRTEFGFDVAQVAKQRYAPKSYHDFIGFKVSKPVLERAFRETYGFELKDIFTALDLSIGSYRHSISGIIPEMTKAALLTQNNVDVAEKNDSAKKKYVYYLSRADYEKDWGKQYERPGFFARVIAFVFKLVPKVGPFKAVAFKTPSTKTEDLYLKSIDDTVARFRHDVSEARANSLQLPDVNLDTAEPTNPGQYKLTDESYYLLVSKLADRKFDMLTPDLKANILDFYRNPAKSITPKRHRKEEWRKLQERLRLLAQSPTVAPDSVNAIK